MNLENSHLFIRFFTLYLGFVFILFMIYSDNIEMATVLFHLFISFCSFLLFLIFI